MRQSRPKFRRQESWRYKRVKSSWRKPIGIDNKMRHHKRGIPTIVKIGYRGPKAVRGLTRSGKIEVLVHNVDELEKVDKKTQIARLASTVGVKKKVAITNRADELDIKIINRPEEALTFATISEISDELLLEDEKGEKASSAPRKKKPKSGEELSLDELDELEKIEAELKKSTKSKTTTTKKSTTTTTTKKPTSTTTKKSTATTAKKPSTTAAKKPATSTTKKTTTTTTKKPSTTTTKKTTSTAKAPEKKSTTSTKSTSSKTTDTKKKTTTTKKE